MFYKTVLNSFDRTISSYKLVYKEKLLEGKGRGWGVACNTVRKK